MNREILFKAKPKNWRQQESENYWVEGYYAQLGTGDNIVHYICQNMALCKLFKKEEDNMYFTDVEIDHSTLCQFTCMTDKNGNKVWEHDIITLNEDIKKIFNVDDGEVRYGWGGFYIKKFSELNSLNTLASYDCILRGEVIGNIFDNPELLEERAQYESV